MSDKNELLERYQEIRGRFASTGFGTVRPPITDRHGFSIPGTGGSLTTETSAVDKLFLTLINNTVEDPDYALRKDPKIYDKMLRDPQIFYCLTVRRVATSSLEWGISSNDSLQNDESASQLSAAAEKRIKKMPKFAEFVDNMLEAILTGVSVTELVWKMQNEEYILAKHLPVDKSRIRFNNDGKIQLLQPQSPSTGKVVPPFKYIAHVPNIADATWNDPSTYGYRYFGRGLADTPLYHYFYFKTMALKFMLQFLERYGMPFKMVYAGNSSPALAARMNDIMSALKNDSVVYIPGRKEDITVDVVDNVRSRNELLDFINYIDTLITRTILGQELMTEMGSVGSYAAAQVHQSVFAMISAKDRTALEDTLNSTLMKYDCALNTPQFVENDEYRPRFGFKKAALLDAQSFLSTVQVAMQLGLPVSESQIRTATGLRAPGPNDLNYQENINVPQTEPEQSEPEPDKPADDGAKKYQLQNGGIVVPQMRLNFFPNRRRSR